MVFTDFIPLLFVLYIYSASPKGSYNLNPSEQSLIKGKYIGLKCFILEDCSENSKDTKQISSGGEEK